MEKMKTLTVSGQTYTVCDPEAVRSIDGQKPDAEGNIRLVDDSCAGAAAWSGRHIADSLCVPFSESGVVVTCRPVVGYPLEVLWENKNLAKADATRTVDAGAGIAVKTTKNSSQIVVNGTATKNHSMRLFSGIVLPAGKYTVSAPGLLNRDYLVGDFLDDTGAGTYIFLNTTGDSPETFTLAQQTSIRITAVFRSDEGSTYNDTPVRIQIEKGSAATAYEPYAETAVITRRGKNICPYATSDQANDSMHLNFYSGADRYSGMTLTASADITRADTALAENGVMRFYIYYTDGSRTTGSAAYGAEKDGLPHKKTITLKAEAGKTIDYLRIIPVDKSVEGDRADNIQLETGNTATDFEPYNSGTFPLGDEIPALPGINTLYANGGFVTVTGRESLTATVEKLTNAIKGEIYV